MPKLFFEDFTRGLVRESAPRTLGTEEIIAFASQYDPQPFHVDPQRAQDSFYGGLIASGWHTCCVGMRMICEMYLLDAASMGSPGIDEIRWTKPVRPGDTVRLRMTVVESKPSKSRPEMGAVRHRWEMFNQHGDLVMHMTGWGLFRRRG